MLLFCLFLCRCCCWRRIQHAACHTSNARVIWIRSNVCRYQASTCRDSSVTKINRKSAASRRWRCGLIAHSVHAVGRISVTRVMKICQYRPIRRVSTVRRLCCSHTAKPAASDSLHDDVTHNARITLHLRLTKSFFLELKRRNCKSTPKRKRHHHHHKILY